MAPVLDETAGQRGAAKPIEIPATLLFVDV
jgi:hypothetical protein